MSILFYVGGLRRGGAERQLAELAPGLVSRGHAVTVAVTYGGEHYERQLINGGVNVLHLRHVARPPKPNFRSKTQGRYEIVTALSRAIRSQDFDVLHSYGREPNMMMSLLGRLYSRPVVWGVRHSTPGSRSPRDLAENLLSKWSSAIIVNSKAGAQVCVSRGYPPDRLHVIENGIDVERFTIVPAWRTEWRNSLGLEPFHKVVGIVGRLNPIKDHETFLKAARCVAATNPEARFVVVGSDYGSHRQRDLMALAQTLGISDRVKWLGVQNDVERILNAFDVAVLSSRREGFPNVVAEAMACGVPCVATDAGDTARIIGDLGEIVPLGDYRALSTGIRQVLHNGSQTRPFEIRASIVRNWGRERMVTRTEEILRSVCS